MHKRAQQVKFQKVEKNEVFKIEGDNLKQCKDKSIKTAQGVCEQPPYHSANNRGGNIHI